MEYSKLAMRAAVARRMARGIREAYTGARAHRARELEREEARRPRGFYRLFKGLFDGTDIAVVITGLAAPSKNVKTGAMLQVYILVLETDPMAASRSGADAAICYHCPHRRGAGGACYVRLEKAPLAIWRALIRSIDPACHSSASPAPYKALDFGNPRHRAWLAGRKLRHGAYGDPAAVEAEFWRELEAIVVPPVKTGYTHQWREAAELRTMMMASVDSLAEQNEARAAGWRTFRVVEPGGHLSSNEAWCPATAEGGYQLTCSGCGGCNGNSRPVEARARASFAVRPHGAFSGRFACADTGAAVFTV